MDFSQVEAQYARLRAQFDVGALSEADFKARLEGLMVEDEQGRWWIIGHETGQWYVHDGEQWTPGEPPRPAAEAPAPPVEVEPDEPIVHEKAQPAAAQRGRRLLWPGLAAGVFCVVLGALVIRQIGRVDARPTPQPAPAATFAAPARPEPTKPPAQTQPTAAPAAGAAVAEPVMQVSAPNCDYGGKLKAIEALDDFTVKFTLCYPDASFAAKIALPPFGIHPAEYLAATAGTDQLLRAPIGTGPYRLESWPAGGELHLEANPDYWGQPANIAHLQFHWLDDANKRLGYLQTGDVEGIDNPPPETYAAIQSNPSLAFYPRAGLNSGYIGFGDLINSSDDARVRRAIALAIDRTWLVKNYYPPGAAVATHFTPCEIPHGCAGEPWDDFDPERARMLLTEAGYPNGFETDLFYRDEPRSYLPNPTGTAQVIADMLEKFLNIRVRLTAVNLDSAAFREASWGGQFPLYLSGWDADYPDPVNFLSPYWSEFGTSRFETGFPETWAFLKEATVTASPVTRAELYARANNLIKRDVPLVPLVHVGSATAFRASVIGAHSSPLNLEQFAVMGLKDGAGSTLVWKQATEPLSLYCADETESDTWRACAQITESLLGFKVGSVEVTPALAERYEPNDNLTEWTFHLRNNVKFHDGSALDASDVVTSWAVQWDAKNPLHHGRTGAFDYFLWFFDAFLNAE